MSRPSNNPAGKPPRSDTISDARISVACTRAERDAWTAAHEALGIRVSDTVRAALDAMVRKAKARR